jgi:PAS domain-containing protein
MGGLARRLTRLKWHYIYFFLAGFDLLTVSAGLYLNHKIIRTYTRSVEINRVWTKEPRLTRISGNWRPPLMHRATMPSTTAGWTRNPRKCGPLRIARQIQTDAEERQRHLEALREAEARTRRILDTAADGIITFDDHGRIESFNQAADCMLGYAVGEAVGQDIRSVIEAPAERLQGRRLSTCHTVPDV